MITAPLSALNSRRRYPDEDQRVSRFGSCRFPRYAGVPQLKLLEHHQELHLFSRLALLLLALFGGAGDGLRLSCVRALKRFHQAVHAPIGFLAAGYGQALLPNLVGEDYAGLGSVVALLAAQAQAATIMA